MPPLISIIIPCYNIEDSINTYFHHLLQQPVDINELQLIFVNDASCDSTYSKLLEWEDRYPNSVLIINLTGHIGTADSITLGVQYATGDYLCFMDGTLQFSKIKRHIPVPRTYTMNVCFATNQKYVSIALVMLYSLFLNNQNADIHVYIFHCELSQKEEQQLLLLAKAWNQEITFINIDANIFESLPTTDAWSKETYFRLLMPVFLPKNIDRFLYLDVDVIINQSIQDFYTTDFDGMDCIACEDILLNRMFKQYYFDNFEELHGKDFTYFNAGIILWNLKELRRDYHFSSYIKKMIKYLPVLQCPDQDILNVMHCNKVKILDWQQYNLQISIAAQKHFSADAVRKLSHIIHFCGPKPWDTNMDFEKYYHIQNANASFEALGQIWKDYAHFLDQEMSLQIDKLHL